MLGAAQASGIETPTAGSDQQALALSGPTPTSPGTTDIASSTPSSQTPGGGFAPHVSSDGKWVVFASLANLQPGNPSAKADQSNVFARDLATGATVQLSRGATGGTPQQPTAGSFLPSVSANGRFVTFLTDATNIVTTSGASPVTLVLCDRDPDQDATYDETNTDGSLTNICVAVHSAGGDQNTAGAIVRFDAPSIATDSFGSSGRVAWTQLIDRPAAPGATARRVYTRPFVGTAGAVTFPSGEAEVSMTLPTSASCGGQSSGSTHEETQPALASVNVVFYVEWFPAGGCEGIASTNALGSPSFSTSQRWDVVPAGCGTGFVGDDVPLIGPCAAGGGGDILELSNPIPDQSADRVVYHFFNGPIVIGFAGPRALAPGSNTDWDLVATDDAGITSDVLSRDNAGNIVTGTGAGISGDGRYAAFSTAATGAHDGADLLTGTNSQIVTRDLTLDAGPTRIKGALATPRDPSRPTPANCTPSGADQSCGSAGGSTGIISLDATGGRIAYSSSAKDLLPAPNDSAATNVYVRTWTPKFADQETPGGTTQTGATRTFNVPVSIGSGFGPLAISAAVLGGADADQFTVTGNGCAGRVIHVNDPCTMGVRFQPSTDGIKHADISATVGYANTTAEAATVVATAIANGPKNAPATTVRTSLDPTGTEGSRDAKDSVISGNGRWDVFASRSDLLGRKAASTAPTHTNVFVRDLADPQNTVQISLHSVFGATAQDPTRPAATPAQPAGTNPDDDSDGPSISSDGRFVSFVTAASDIAPLRKGGGNTAADNTFSTLVVCDRDPDADGTFDELRAGTQLPDYRCFSVESGSFDDDGRGLDLQSRPVLSGDGSRIAWVESADDNSGTRRIRYADLPRTAGGALATPTNFTYLTSTVPGFEQGATVSNTPESGQYFPAINEDGTKIAYFAQRFPSAGPGNFAVIEADLAAGTDQRVDGLGNANSDDGVEIEFPPAVSDDGNRVAFGFYDPDAQRFSVYVSTITGGTVTRQLESRDNDGQPADGRQPALSGDGRYLAFVATGPQMSNGVDPPLTDSRDNECFDNPTETDFGVVCQVVARDLAHDEQLAAAGQGRLPNELVSAAVAGTKCPNTPAAGRLCGGNAPSTDPSIDNTGSEIGFDSDASDLVSDDTNDFESEGHVYTADAFVHTWRPTITSTPIDFGSVKIGSSNTKNVGESVLLLATPPEAFGPISLGKATITGVAAADYQVVANGCAGKTLHEGAPEGQPLGDPAERCTIKLRFKPVAQGTRTAALRVPIGKNSYPRVIRSATPPNAIVQQFDPAAVRTLTGFGATSVIVVNPTLNFGNRRAKDPLTKTLTVKNTGSTPLVISGVVVNDTTHPGAKNDYTVNFSNCLPAVAPGASCVISVKFSGSRVGIRDTVMVISSNASAGTTSVGLLARVLKPTIDSNPAVSQVRRVITITGDNFAPNRLVQVGFDDDVQVEFKTDAHGHFEDTMIVLPAGVQGPRVLFGHSKGLSPTIRGEFDFLVVLGSSAPGNGVVTRN